VSIPQRKGDPLVFKQDECPRETNYETLTKMAPAFQKNGFCHRGQRLVISDGAAAVVVMAEERAKALGCKVMAAVGAQASTGST